MNPPQKSRITEERLQEIKRIAEENSRTNKKHASPPQIQGRDSYYELPALKPPLWTWQVPLYFFIGGISGVSGCMAFIAQLFRRDPSLIRVLLWVGFGGALVCPALLIADLGRPARFLNMLRVFKWRSPMSLGAWILVGFSTCITPALLAHELIIRGYAHGYTHSLIVAVRWAGEASGSVTGLLLACYTGVLIGATAIPVWSHNRKILPTHFLTSGLGGSSAILELAGFLIPATHILGFVASGIETILEIFFEVQQPAVNAPLHHGRSGVTFRVAGLLEGPSALLLRIFWGSSPTGRHAAAICFLVGALLSRYAWILAGRASAEDPKTQFSLQRSGAARP
jgi:formate-dependent nitrite reductase membrane component NrfD